MRKKEDKYDFRAFGLAIKEARLKRGLTRECFLQALFGQNCKTFLDIVACPNWTKLQCLGWQQTYQLRAIADII